MAVFQLFNKLFFSPRVTEEKKKFLHPKDQPLENIGKEVKYIVNELYGGRSLRIRAVDGGSCNGEEIELTALGNAYYDIERFGLSFVASPRHADMLLVSGPVTRNLENAVKTTYEAAPEPCIVVAVGDGACDGGMWKDSYAVVGAVEKVIPVHYKIRGNPPTPTQILSGVLHCLKNQTQP